MPAAHAITNGQQGRLKLRGGPPDTSQGGGGEEEQATAMAAVLPQLRSALAKSDPMTRLNIIVHNVMSAVSPGRMEELATELHAHVVILVGTRTPWYGHTVRRQWKRKAWETSLT